MYTACNDVNVYVSLTLCTVVSLIWPVALTKVTPPALANTAASVLTRAVVTLVFVAAPHSDVRLDA